MCSLCEENKATLSPASSSVAQNRILELHHFFGQLGNRADEQPCLLGLEICHRRVPYFSLKSRRAASLCAVEKLAWVEKARPGEELRTMETFPMHFRPKFGYLLSMDIWVHAIRANGGTNACSCHQNNWCNPKHTARSAQHQYDFNGVASNNSDTRPTCTSLI